MAEPGDLGNKRDVEEDVNSGPITTPTGKREYIRLMNCTWQLIVNLLKT